MITFFNKLGNSWIAKIILGLLALSMLAFWGLGGLANVSAYDASNDAIVVGKKGVSAQQLSQAFETARKNFSAMTGGKYLSPSKAVEMGLFDNVLQQEIASAVEESLNEELGVTASNAAVSRYIEKNPVFADVTGRFDKNMFYAYLTHMGMNERQLAARLKKELAYKHVTDTIAGLGYAPSVAIRAADFYANEKRDGSLLVMSPQQVRITEQPTEEDLNNYYEAFSEELMSPEYRSLTVALLTPNMMLERVSVDAADIEALYEEQKEKYNVPEKRDLYQMFFKTEEEAADAMTDLTAQNFEAVASQKTAQTAEETHFGLTAQNQLMEELAEPVFKAEKGAIVGPIASATGWHVLWVKDVEAAQVTPADKVKAEIKKSLALDKTYEAVEELARQLEDELGLGTALTDAAAKLNIPVEQIEKTDISGVKENGELVADQLKNQELMQELFTLKKGDVSSLVRTDDGYIIAEVTDITPVSVKPFDHVKNEVRALWLKEKQQERFAELVKSLTEKAENGASFDSLADTAAGQFEVQSFNGVTRADESTFALPELAAVVFAQKANEVASVPAGDGVTLVRVTAIHQPTVNQEPTKEFVTEVQGAQASLLNTAMVSSYADRVGVKVNQKIVEKVLSQYKSQE